MLELKQLREDTTTKGKRREIIVDSSYFKFESTGKGLEVNVTTLKDIVFPPVQVSMKTKERRYWKKEKNL